MGDAVNNNVEVKKQVDQPKQDTTTKSKSDKQVESIMNTGASAFLSGPNSYALMGGAGIFGGDMFNPGYCMNGGFQEKFVPSAISLFSIPNYFAPATFGGYIQNMWDTWTKMFPGKSASTDNTSDKKPVDGADNKTDAEKFIALKEEAKQYNVTVEDKDTYDTLKAKVDAAKVKAGEKPETKAGGKADNKADNKAGRHTGGAGSKHHKHVELNPHDIKTATGHNHLYTDENGDRICKRYGKDGKLVNTITYRDGEVVSNVPSKESKEAVKTEGKKKEEAVKENKVKAAEASKICKELYVAMKGCGTDESKLNEYVNKINSGNIMEVMQEWNKRYSSRMGGETLVESIDNDVFGAQKYTDHLKNAMVDRATKMGLAEDAQAFDAEVTSENKATFWTNDGVVERSFNDMLEQMEKKQK